MYSIFYKMKPSNFVKIYFYYFQYLLIYYIQITKLPFYFTLKIVRAEDQDMCICIKVNSCY